MKMGSAPCFQCNERYFGCHGKCEKYLSFRKERDRQNDERTKRLEILYGKKVIFSKSKRERIERGKGKR